MKRFFILFVLLFSIISCQDQLEDNSPAIQGNKDGNLWRATSFAADIDAGGFVIEGRNLSERVQLITTNDARGIFDISIDSGNFAVYVDTDGTVYSTKNLPNTDAFLSPPDGQIIVEDIDNLDPKGIYGTFWFNAYTIDGLKRVNFNRGVFYKTPLLGGSEAID